MRSRTPRPAAEAATRHWCRVSPDDDGDIRGGKKAPLEIGDLISYRDDGGALHLAVAYMDYPAFLPYGSYDPKESFHVAYFSDHRGDSVRQSDARSALEDLRRLTWFVNPVSQPASRMSVQRAIASRDPGSTRRDLTDRVPYLRRRRSVSPVRAVDHARR
jgi:hypothetical protein